MPCGVTRVCHTSVNFLCSVGDFVEERDKVQRAGGVWREVAEVLAGTYPDFAALVHYERAYDARWDEDLSPGDAVVLDDGSAGVAEVHDAITILEDRPDLWTAVVVPCRVVHKDRHSDFFIQLNRGVGRRG